MKRLFVFVMLIALALSACAPKAAATESGPLLIVTDGATQKTYSVDAMKALGAVQVTAKDVTYVGVKLSDLIKDAGFDPASLAAVKATASDGFSANYEAAQFNAEDTLVAYATSTGALTAEEGTFRMVLPAGGRQVQCAHADHPHGHQVMLTTGHPLQTAALKPRIGSLGHLTVFAWALGMALLPARERGIPIRAPGAGSAGCALSLCPAATLQAALAARIGRSLPY